jgi:hypothetical protein
MSRSVYDRVRDLEYEVSELRSELEPQVPGHSAYAWGSSFSQDIPTDKQLRGIWLSVAAITSGNAETVTFNPDGPYSVIKDVSIYLNGKRYCTISGFQLAMIRKWGGYFLQGDPAMDGTYVATTGGGGTGGSFASTLWVPADALPVYTPDDTLNVVVTLAQRVSDVYGTPPTTRPKVSLAIRPDTWWDGQPEPAKVKARWVVYNEPSSYTTYLDGAANWELTERAASLARSVSVSERIRQIQIHAYGAPQRQLGRVMGDHYFPDVLSLTNGDESICIPKGIWKSSMSMARGYTAANAGTATTTDTPNSVNNGVYVIDRETPFDALNFINDKKTVTASGIFNGPTKLVVMALIDL